MDTRCSPSDIPLDHSGQANNHKPGLSLTEIILVMAFKKVYITKSVVQGGLPGQPAGGQADQPSRPI